MEVEHTDPDYERLPYRLTMAVAPTKNAERFEWFLEKATEIGVTEIVPIATRAQRTPGLQTRAGRQDPRSGHEAVAQGVPAPASPPSPLCRTVGAPRRGPSA